MADQVLRASTELSAIVPEVWSSRFYDVLLAELPFSSLVTRDYEGEIRDLGDIVNISSFPEFDDGVELAEDAKADADAITVSGQQLVINKRVVKDFILTRLAMVQSLEAMDKLREMAIYAIMKKMEKTIIENIVPSVPSASAPDHQIAYTSGTTLDLAKMLEAKELLDTQNVPSADRHMVLGAAQVNDIFNIVGFTSSDFLMAGAPLQSGQLPAGLLGFLPHSTTLVGNVAYFFHRSFMTMAMQEQLQIAEYDLGVDGKRARRVNLDLLYGLKQLDNKRVVSVS